jgi:hypothetical protein
VRFIQNKIFIIYFQEKSNQFLTYRPTITSINSQDPIDQSCRNIKINLQIESKPKYPIRHETREEFL